MESSIPFVLVIMLSLTIAPLGNSFVIPQLQEPEQTAFTAGWGWMRRWCVVPDPDGIPTLSSASGSAR